MSKNPNKKTKMQNKFIQIPELDYKMLVAQNERMKEQITSLQSDCRQADTKPTQPKNNYQIIKELSLDEMVEHYYKYTTGISNDFKPGLKPALLSAIRDWLLADGGNE